MELMLVWFTIYHKANLQILVTDFCFDVYHFLLSHVLFGPWSRGALHQVFIRPQAPGGDDHSV